MIIYFEKFKIFPFKNHRSIYSDSLYEKNWTKIMLDKNFQSVNWFLHNYKNNWHSQSVIFKMEAQFFKGLIICYS